MSYRTVRRYEQVGVAGVHIEDEQAPKHSTFDGPLLTIADMQARIAAAVDARADPDFLLIARSDELYSQGGGGTGSLDEAVRRGIAYAEAGADVYLPTFAPAEDLARIADEVPIPIAGYGQLVAGVVLQPVHRLGHRVGGTGASPMGDASARARRCPARSLWLPRQRRPHRPAPVRRDHRCVGRTDRTSGAPARRVGAVTHTARRPAPAASLAWRRHRPTAQPTLRGWTPSKRSYHPRHAPVEARSDPRRCRVARILDAGVRGPVARGDPGLALRGRRQPRGDGAVGRGVANGPRRGAGRVPNLYPRPRRQRRPKRSTTTSTSYLCSCWATGPTAWVRRRWCRRCGACASPPVPRALDRRSRRSSPAPNPRSTPSSASRPTWAYAWSPRCRWAIPWGAGSRPVPTRSRGELRQPMGSGSAVARRDA